ncbi:MAG: hypothetical protein GY940_20765, partial [bacterium]|nr:hypothetical protein [bacterium]
PHSFIFGLLVTLLYIGALIFDLYRIHTRAKGPEPEIHNPEIKFKKGESALLGLCKTVRVREAVFRYLRSQGIVACIDNLSVDFNFNGLPVKTILRFFCRLAVVEEQRAIDYLKKMGLGNLNKVELTNEDILKIYAAVKIAGDPSFVVFNNFFEMKSRQFEASVLNLLYDLEKDGHRILFLSCDLPNAKEENPIYKEMKKKLETFASFPLELGRVTLR